MREDAVRRGEEKMSDSMDMVVEEKLQESSVRSLEESRPKRDAANAGGGTAKRTETGEAGDRGAEERREAPERTGVRSDLGGHTENREHHRTEESDEERVEDEESEEEENEGGETQRVDEESYRAREIRTTQTVEKMRKGMIEWAESLKRKPTKEAVNALKVSMQQHMTEFIDRLGSQHEKASSAVSDRETVLELLMEATKTEGAGDLEEKFLSLRHQVAEGAQREKALKRELARVQESLA